MKDFVSFLAAQSREDSIRINKDLDDALARLDHLLQGVSDDLQVEYYGPFVGVETPEAHQLVVRAHEWEIGQYTWSMKICSTAPQANYRPEWAIQGASRLRKQLVVKSLPAFFEGYAQAVKDAGKGELASARRLVQLAEMFGKAS